MMKLTMLGKEQIALSQCIITSWRIIVLERPTYICMPIIVQVRIRTGMYAVHYNIIVMHNNMCTMTYLLWMVMARVNEEVTMTCFYWWAISNLHQTRGLVCSRGFSGELGLEPSMTLQM